MALFAVQIAVKHVSVLKIVPMVKFAMIRVNVWCQTISAKRVWIAYETFVASRVNV